MNLVKLYYSYLDACTLFKAYSSEKAETMKIHYETEIKKILCKSFYIHPLQYVVDQDGKELTLNRRDKGNKKISFEELLKDTYVKNYYMMLIGENVRSEVDATDKQLNFIKILEKRSTDWNLRERVKRAIEKHEYGTWMTKKEAAYFIELLNR